MQHAVSEVERSGDTTACSLALCLAFCLNDAEHHSSRCANLLRAAIGQLQGQAPTGAMARRDGAADMTVLISYLQYLLPELEARSPSAANFVSQAVSLFKRSTTGSDSSVSATLH